MTFNATEIEALLRQQRRFHQEQLRLIDIALSAIAWGKKHRKEANKGPAANGVKRHRIQWTREIERFLDDYDEFTVMDLQGDLAEKRGIAAAMTIQGRNVINNTLIRFEKKGRIQKTRPGVYQVIKESFPS